MEWGDIDAGGALIALSAERMKALKQHRVPLTLPLALWLVELPRVAGCALIHDGRGGRPMSDIALAKALRNA